MKILLVIENLKLGGKQRRFIQLIKGLKQHENIKFEIVILSKNIEYKEIFRLVDNIYYMERKWKQDPFLCFRLFKLFNRIKPDIVHSWGSMSSIYVLPLVIIKKVKFINSMIVHATPVKYYHEDWIRSKLTFPFSSAVIANSFAGLNAFNIKSDRGYVVYNGFDFNRLNNITDTAIIKNSLNIKTRHVVGMVGAFEERKDYDLFIKAGINTVKDRDDVTFITVGDGKDLIRCKNLVPDDLKHRIIFTGHQYDVESIINIFDIGVLTTNINFHREGISNSIMEYMALGKPVIATKGGGTDEIIIDNKTGYLVEPYSIEELITKIKFLLDSSDIAAKMGKEGKLLIKNKFNLDNMISAYIKIYKEVIMK